MSKKILYLQIVGVRAIAPRAFAAFGFKQDGTLDKEAISHAYSEGEFPLNHTSRRTTDLTYFLPDGYQARS